MTSDRWRQIEALYHAALQREPAERAGFVEAACGSDAELRREVAALLSRQAAAGSSGEHRPWADGAPWLEAGGRAATSGLRSGSRVGAYEVVAALGAGGMGEVYRAHDATLGRDVALKVLPPQFGTDAERVARFEREARVLAALSHPRIAQIYGLETVGEQRVLVLELVPGASLAERLRGGALPLREALEVCRQIAEGLEAAHEKGIVHRDLKPANVQVTPEGQAKILDFGLAKILDVEVVQAASDAAAGATMTAGPTRQGVVLGTAAYMSPEQARGEAVDKRADIWAFGCVLFECLTGRRAFGGKTTSDTLAAVLEREPDWAALPAATPPHVRVLLQRCLRKDARERLRDVGDARLDLAEAVPSGPVVIAAGGAVGSPHSWSRGTKLWMSATALLATLAAWALWPGRPTSSALPQPVRYVQVPTPYLSVLNESTFDISRDGSRLVYVGEQDGKRQLFLRPMDSADASSIPGTENALSPFFSPDGRWIAFWTDQQLKKISLSGGSAITLCDSPVDVWALLLKASWSADDWIVLASMKAGGRGVLERLKAGGGTPEPIVDADAKRGKYYLYQPELLPGSQAILFTAAAAGGGNFEVAVRSLASAEYRTLIKEASGAHYLPTGHLVYEQAGKLMAAAFDPKRLALTGTPAVVVNELSRWAAPRGAAYAVSDNGTLAYFRPFAASTDSYLVWVDRRGHEQPITNQRRPFEGVQLSPDGTKLSTWTRDDLQVWVMDIERRLLTRVTTRDQNAWSIWSVDGRRLAFNSLHTDSPGTSLFWQSADGAGAPERLTTSELLQQPRSFSPDGKLLIFQEWRPDTGYDICAVSVDQGAQPRQLLHTAFNEFQPKLSWDGRWLAYVSNESGRDEIYVRPFPAMDRKWQISSDGGVEPAWSRDGHELYYRVSNKPRVQSTLMAVSINTAGEFRPGTPKTLFEGPYVIVPVYGQSYDVSSDGRFVMVKADAQSSPKEINVVLNWFEDLKRKTAAR